MNKKQERAYFDKEWNDMKASLKSYLKKEQQEDLHRFRVQVKKLRAFLILADSADQQPKLAGYFKPVRKIFKQAGEIRNAYMNQKLGESQHIHNDEFMNNQQQLQVEASRKFKAKKVRFLKKLKDVHYELKRKIQPISDLHVNLFYQTQLEQIANFIEKIEFNDQLHDCRKQVKILLYNYKLTQPVLDTKLNEEYLKVIQTEIGDWHDHILAIELFSSDEVKDNAVVINLKKQDDKLKSDITATTKDFYNQATTVVDLPVEQVS
jgi:CHAD domain-containing protein